MSHLGVSTGDDPNALYSFQDQIDHKIECFDILKKRYSADDTKFVLMGHSIGAYLAVEVFKQRHAFNIDRLIALFPCLYDIALTPNGMHFTVRFRGWRRKEIKANQGALNYFTISAYLTSYPSVSSLLWQAPSRTPHRLFLNA